MTFECEMTDNDDFNRPGSHRAEGLTQKPRTMLKGDPTLKILVLKADKYEKQDDEINRTNNKESLLSV